MSAFHPQIFFIVGLSQEPRPYLATVTLLISPLIIKTTLFWSKQKISQSFFLQVYTATQLIEPEFCGPLVTWLTKFTVHAHNVWVQLLEVLSNKTIL